MKSSVLLFIFILSMIFGYAQHATKSPDAFKYQALNAKYSVQERSYDDYDVTFYFLDLIMNNESIDVEGTVRIDFETISPGITEIVLDLDNQLNVAEVRLDNTSVSYTHEDNAITIPLSKSKSRAVHTVEVDYAGTPPYGMFNETYPYLNETTTFSLSEPYDAMGWFPVKQDLSDKADSSWVFVTVPDNLMAGSNGLLTDTTNMGDGTTRYEWKSKYPIEYYLISVAIGNYQDYSFYCYPEGTDSVLVQNYIYDSPYYFTFYEEDILKTGDMIEVLSDYFGLYPHHEEKYGHCIVELNGGMEHQTMTTVGNFNFTLIAHELGHSWFGNYLTCATWQDIWINEGFAVYTEYLTSQALRTEAETRNWLELNAEYAKEYNDGSVYVPFSEVSDPSRIFDYYLTYKKGGMLVHMIRYLLGDAMFFDVLQAHLNEYGNSVATGDDFKTVIENISGTNFDDFFDQWYYGEGYPIYNIEWHQTNDTVYIHTNQAGSCPQAPLFTIPPEYMLYFENGDSLMVQLSQDAYNVSHKIPETRPVDSIVFDPNLWLIQESVVQEVSSIPTHNFSCHVYPNPAHSRVQIKTGKNGNYRYELMDVYGQAVKQGHFSSGTYTMDLSEINRGIYFLRIFEGKYAFKIDKLVVN
ncbi:MAG: M1 family aminopeptidase [Bacteroidales bacterium]